MTLSLAFQLRGLRRIRRGFTIVEMAVSTVIIGLIAVAVGSSMVGALKAVQIARDPTSSFSQSSTARSALDRFSDDLKVATKIEPLYTPPYSTGTTGLTLTVPARNGDSSSEVIVYSWAGAGQPLMRQYNGQTSVSIADNVNGLSFAITPEQIIMSHDGGSGSTVKTTALTSTNWIGEYFIPVLPSGTTTWKLTHLQLQLERVGVSTGNLTVKVYSADVTQKPLNLLGSANVDISTVSSTAVQWVDVPITGVTGISASSGLCIVVGSSASIGYGVYHNSAATTNTAYLTSTTGGSSWSAATNKSLQFTVFGAAQ